MQGIVEMGYVSRAGHVAEVDPVGAQSLGDPGRHRRGPCLVVDHVEGSGEPACKRRPLVLDFGGRDASETPEG